MLNANKILIFLSIFLFTSSLYAVDVSEFDIKGIKIGMSKSDVLKKISCREPKIEKSYVNTLSGKRVYKTDIVCNTKNETLTIVLSRKNIVYSVHRSKEFKISPNWKTIEKKIIQRYKNPTHEIERNNPSVSNSRVFRMRWINNDKELVIHSHNWNDIYIIFYLYNQDRENENARWAVKQEELYNQKQKEKASDIDF